MDHEQYKAAVGVVTSEHASTSLVQRRLVISYKAAAELMQAMEDNGVVSKCNHVGKREVLMKGGM